MKAIFHFIGNYFEFILVVNLLFVIVYLLMKIVAAMQVERSVHKGVDQILHWLVVTGQAVMLYIYGAMLWINYQAGVPPMKFPQEVIFHTRWIKDPLNVYFVEKNKLKTVRLNGQNLETVFEAPSSIREYHFSPDGERLLVVTIEELYVLDLKTRQADLIDTIKDVGVNQMPEEDPNIKGVISSVRWAPDSQKFYYEVSRWSSSSSIDEIYVYDLAEKIIRTFPSPTRRIFSLYWDKDARHLYYLRSKSLDPAESPYPYEIDVYKIAWEDLRPVSAILSAAAETQIMARIPSYEKVIPWINLRARLVDLYLEGDQLAFGKLGVQKPSLKSEKGRTIGIDKQDYLYLTRGQWFRKRLFKIPRDLDYKALEKYQYKGGDFTIESIRWIDDSPYVLLVDKYQDVLILDSLTGSCGRLMEGKYDVIGWIE